MEKIFLTLLDRSIDAGWVILAVMALRLLLKKAPRWTVCLLWAAAAARLVCPVGVESAFSLIPRGNVLRLETVQMPAAVPGGVMVPGGGAGPAAGTVPNLPPAAGADPLQALPRLAGMVWAAGLVLLLAWALLGYLRLWRQVREAAWVEGQVWACDGIATPFILGVLRPRIYLPSAMAAEQTRYVLAHEYAHLRRKDHWWKLLGYILLSVYWFHPLVWAGYVLFCRDLELACDERAVRDLDLQGRKAYSRALLACSTRGGAVAACPLAFGETGVRARIRAVLHYRKPAFWMVLLGAAACVIVAVCFLTDPETPPEPDPAPEFSFQGTIFTFGDETFDLGVIQPSVTAIMEVTPAEKDLVVECHVSPDNSYYGIFDTASRSFVSWIAGAHFIWRGGNVTTGVYVFWDQLYRYPGEFIADLDLEEGAYVYDLTFREDGRSVVATIVNNEELTTVEVPLPYGDSFTPVYTYDGTVLTYDGADYDLRDMNPLMGAITACTLAGDKLLLETDINYYGIFDTASRDFLPGISADQMIWCGDNLSTAVYTYAGRLFRYGGVLLTDLELGEGEEVASLEAMGDASAVTVTIRTPDGGERAASVALTAPGPLSTGYTPYAAYNLLIAQAREALTSHQRPEGQEADPFSSLFYMPGSQDYQTMGWLLRDLDGDGVEELIFGENDNSGWNGIVYDLYTLSGGQAVHLLSGWERSRYYLCENGAIAHEGSNGAADSGWAYYSYVNGELRLVEALRSIGDVTGADGGQRNYYITGVEDLDGFDEGWEEWTLLSDREAEAVRGKYVYLEPRFTPFTAVG